MRNTAYFLLIAFGLSSSLLAQQSDYETVVEFQSEIELIKHQIDNAITSKQLKNIEIEIEEFKVFYSESKDLLDRAIYPNNFESSINNLKSTLINNENRLLLIEHQREQLFELSNRITAQRTEINRLYIITDSLKNEILTSQASEARLSEMITNYREQLLEKDRLIFEMIDSLLVTHDNIVFQNSSDGEQSIFSILDSQNPLSWIETVLEESTNYSRHQNRLLEVEDYIRMYALQQHFETVWSKVGDDLITVYGGDQKTITAQSIESNIRDWRISSAQRMWSAIDKYLDIHGIELSAFDNREGFYSALEAYIKNGKRLSESEILTTNGFSDYQKIASFWRSTFKNEWNLVAEDSRLLDPHEIEVIDVALINWEQASRPIHPMLVAILSIMIVSLTGFILVMIRSKATR